MRQRLKVLEKRLAGIPKSVVVDFILKDVLEFQRAVVARVEALEGRLALLEKSEASK